MKRRVFINSAFQACLGATVCSLAACRRPGDERTFHPSTSSQEFWALDLEVQELARRYVAAPIIERVRKHRLPADTDLALIVLENDGGEVIAYIGNRGDSKYDFAQIARNSGSLMKPLCYAIALESGVVSPNEKFIDTRFSLKCDSCKGGVYSPRNYGDRYRKASVPLTTALAHSINTVAMQVFQRVDAATMKRKIQALGLPQYTNPLTAALGWEISPLKLCAAFTALSSSDGGVVAPRFVLEKNVNGVSQPTPVNHSERVFREDVVQFIRQALHECLTAGTGITAANLADRLVGKTGSSSDAWALVYGRRITAILWIGRQESTYEVGLTGGKLSMPLLADLMRALADARPDLLPRWSN